MCNPNSSIANRRFRLAAYKNGGATANLLKQRLVGSLMTVPPTLGKTKNKEIKEQPRSNVDVEPIDVDYSHPSLSDGTHDETFVNDRSYSVFPLPSAYLQDQAGNVDKGRFQQPDFVAMPVPIRKRPKAKRKRAPQKPGLTAKCQERHFVQHNYHDHAMDTDNEDNSLEDSHNGRQRGGVSVSFPTKLHSVLEQVELDGFAHVISWQPHGRCFCIHKPKEFVDSVMPHYFRQTKLTSFQRQLNLYGFQRLTRGIDSGGYYQELFLRHKAFLCKRMVRTKVKGTKYKAASSPEQEPNFYSMRPVTVTVTPDSSDCGKSENGDSSSEHDSYGDDSVESSDFRTPHHSFGLSSPLLLTPSAQPQQMPETPMVNKLALDIFGSNHVGTTMVIDDSPIPVDMTSNYVSFPVDASAPSFPMIDSNEYLDQAIDDLFIGDSQAADDVMDFVDAWDEPFDMGPISNDLELGNILDKILEE